MLTDETRYRIIKSIEQNPEISQRELAEKLGISLGKANYCIKALIEKGIVKASNFRNSKNKLAYLYKLTPKGIEAKAAITAKFLKIKMREYEQLEIEIEELRKESLRSNSSATVSDHNPKEVQNEENK
ncbi:Transcriptional regulator, MarR family [Methylophaga frappieri]|uniref:Transcriptional regulator, MarR family n=1 Tax=Methylophaga frappieri (strain ATCC BAA-2434 / DSM 25690 / JAM7) TaxID=754477 RepID=I1YG70_METFJ|nr:MarR family EPS-associated transcriptional regulator [Methylophaga frappieri]AFJ01913.1 Transcriptional regulator, MarR family [Methylophaga frappieri]